MKNSFLIILSFFIFLSSRPVVAQESTGIPPKVKTFLSLAGYGAGGGALLGLASMAFGTKPRAIAQGASLGLYAGLLFGTYVLVSHHQKTNYYETESPYTEDAGDFYDNDDSSNPPSAPGVNLFNPSSGSQLSVLNHEKLQVYHHSKSKKGSDLPLFQMNIVSISF